MAEIERMAALCMKDLDDDEMGDESLEDDEDLLVNTFNPFFYIKYEISISLF